MIQSRTHNCNELRIGNVGERVTLVGWFENMRKVIFRCSTYDHLGTLTGRNKGFCSIIPLCKGKTMAFYPAGKYHRIFFCQIRMYKGSTACKTGSVRRI